MPLTPDEIDAMKPASETIMSLDINALEHLLELTPGRRHALTKLRHFIIKTLDLLAWLPQYPSQEHLALYRKDVLRYHYSAMKGFLGLLHE